MWRRHQENPRQPQQTFLETPWEGKGVAPGLVSDLGLHPACSCNTHLPECVCTRVQTCRSASGSPGQEGPVLHSPTTASRAGQWT